MASFPLSTVDPLEKLRTTPQLGPRAKPLPLGIQSLDAALPDAGLPRGGVVEIGSPAGLGGATRLALAACVSAQRVSANKSIDGECAWCAWIDSSNTLYAPGAIQAGIDLERLLVVRPDPEDIARIAVRITTSGVFSVVVIDRSGVPGAELGNTRARWTIAVRRLALAAEANNTTILLLSTTSVARKESLPTAMRIELSRPRYDRLSLRITKDRRGRLSGPIAIDSRDLFRVRQATAGSSVTGSSVTGSSTTEPPKTLHLLP
ncbi:MAG: recombinase A [Deltaproteobacteria bacterium]|nr:MAG: recombinase A [Deltaproteobacteria bacterium]